MEIDQSQSESQSQSSKQKVEALTGHLSSSLAKLSNSSRGIPSDKDFYFYNNFDEFKLPIKQISDKSNLMLGAIGSGAHVWGKEMSFPVDFDDAYDWMVNVNDEVFERIDVSIDEFQALRKKEEEGGFQLVYGKNKKKDRGEDSSVKVASRDKKTTGTKPKVPFHIPTIPRPQDEYRIVVNNTNQPFQHVWLQRSEDGSRLIHPQEKFSASDFVDNNIGDVETVKPLPIESTPFKLVEEVKDLKELAAKLRYVNEFAVDLEHNHYRSFQGLTCLMQISTRTEDFIVDTLKLRVHIGPYLRDVFKDPMKKKVMHGAVSDILWLQRDFGIYVCNLFDTGQASRVLKMERNSLEYLLYHFCGVTANKEYQQADWRLRPIPDEMLKYAREDTHYLLHMYDLLRIRLLSTSSESEEPDDLLIEVYKRSYDLCMQLYEKELWTESSYLYIYGLRGADLNARQLAIVQGLSEWRDGVARAEDESTAKQVPVTASQLRHVMNSKHPYVERNLGSVVSIIRLSLQNAPAFAAVVDQLKEGSIGRASGENIVAVDESEALDPEAPASTKLKDSIKLESNGAEICRNQRRGASKYVNQDGNNRSETDHIVTNLQRGNSIISGQSAGVTVQVLKKPSRAFGAMLGNSTAKRKLDSVKIDKGEFKLEQIKSSVNLPFHSFVGSAEQLPQHAKEKPKISEIVHQVESPAAQTASCLTEDILLLEGDANHIETGILEVKDDHSDYKGNRTLESASEIDEGDEPMSLSDLSSSFKKCLQPTQNGAPNQFEKLKASSGFLQLKPFDYEAARGQFRLGEDSVVGKGEVGDGGHRTRLDRRKSSALVQSQKDEGNKEFAQGRRRQAFPASGNRSATFR